MDKHGVLVHIDFGFILSNCPGNIRFETAPFKLTTDMVFLITKWCLDATCGSSRIVWILSVSEFVCSIGVTMTMDRFESLKRSAITDPKSLQLFNCTQHSSPHYHAFRVWLGWSYQLDDPQKTILALSQRLEIRESPSAFTKELIRQSIGSWTTHWYDQFQFYMTGIF